VGQALPIAVRKEIVSLRLSGKTHAQISQHLGVAFATVRHIWGDYKREGEAGLQTKYHNSGTKTKRKGASMHRIVLWLKHLHPSWGAGRIRIGLLSRYPKASVPSERTMQRWFREKKPD
jgi:transposase